MSSNKEFPDSGTSTIRSGETKIPPRKESVAVRLALLQILRAKAKRDRLQRTMWLRSPRWSSTASCQRFERDLPALTIVRLISSPSHLFLTAEPLLPQDIFNQQPAWCCPSDCECQAWGHPRKKQVAISLTHQLLRGVPNLYAVYTERALSLITGLEGGTEGRKETIVIGAGAGEVHIQQDFILEPQLTAHLVHTPNIEQRTHSLVRWLSLALAGSCCHRCHHRPCCPLYPLWHGRCSFLKALRLQGLNQDLVEPRQQRRRMRPRYL